MIARLLDAFLFALALWLGLYLLERDARSPRLLLTGLGLIAYALALACDLLASTAAADIARGLRQVQWPLLVLPALLWAGALTHLLPADFAVRRALIRTWQAAATPIAILLLVVGFRTSPAVDRPDDPSHGGFRLAIGAVLLLVLLALGALLWVVSRPRRERRIFGLFAVVTLFFGLSTGLQVVSLGLFPRALALGLLGLDLICLGVAIAYFDAFDQGEALLPDMLRSFDAAFLVAVLFAGQVELVILLSTGPTMPMLSLLLATLAAAVALTTFARPLDNLLDRAALRARPGVRAARAELRAAAEALPRADPTLDPASLDEAEFTRLTRRALSHFGDLPRLATSPLINLTLIERRLVARGAPTDTLERAAELKSALAESIARLKPRDAGEFGTSDQWRHYNALYFPYVAGLKPYSRRADHRVTDPASREALAWFRAAVPERTLYNWQTAATLLVARDLRARDEAERRH